MKRITLREVVKENLGAVLKLEVAEDQRRFVAGNAVSLAQAYVSRARAGASCCDAG